MSAGKGDTFLMGINEITFRHIPTFPLPPTHPPSVHSTRHLVEAQHHFLRVVITIIGKLPLLSVPKISHYFYYISAVIILGMLWVRTKNSG
jgi:hypothetical protein